MNEDKSALFALIGELYFNIRLLNKRVVELETKLQDKQEKEALNDREFGTSNK